MFPLIGGLVSAGAGLLGSIFGSETSAKNTQEQIMAQEQMQQQSQQFNAQQAQLTRDFQQQMSSTAYQRSVKDMESAGLNPMLAGINQSGASTPGGATASSGTPNVPMSQRTSPLAGLGDAVKQGFATAVQSKELDLLSERAANVDLQNKDLKRQLELDRPGVDVGRTQADTATTMARETILKQLATINAPDETKAKIWESLPESVKKGQVWSDVGGDVVGNVSKVAKPVLDVARSALGPTKSSARDVRRGMELERQGPSRWGSGGDLSDRFYSGPGGE